METRPAGTAASTDPPPALDTLTRAPIKRARPQLSCTPCRQGKLKCNREHPVCDQCVKRLRGGSCQYPPPPLRNKQAQNMRSRIRNLESLVVNLIQQKEQEGSNDLVAQVPVDTQTAKKDGTELTPDTFGQLHISNSGNETSYVGAGHWSAVLKEIEEVKNSLEDDDADETQEEEWDDAAARSSVTFGMPKPITKAQLIEAMPPKDEVDRLLPLWFNSADPLLYIMHAPSFQEEYKQFWKDPSSASAMWIALIYCTMSLGIILGPRNPGISAHAPAFDRSSGSLYEPSGADAHLSRSVDRFQQLASSALVLADITKSQPYTLETLMIYGECEFLRRDDCHAKIWLMHGVALRTAMRMGYHRDPANFKGMSPFQGEMRRRTWHVINMTDTLISFAIGLPAQVRRIESDVRVPRNLYDADLFPNMTELPKERPDTEVTPASYFRAKARVCAVFAEAAELSQKITPPRYTTIVALEKKLEDAHDTIPEGMRVRPMEECITDPPVLVMSRLNIELLYLKTRMVLHRNYFTAGQCDPRFAASRTISVDTAVTILDWNKVIFHACQPGGQLHKVWWYMASLQTYDFLLAAMILCLELHHIKAADALSARAAELYGILETTHDIWANHPNRFRESLRGAGILKAMLAKCSSPDQAKDVQKDSVSTEMEKSKCTTQLDFKAKHQAQMLPILPRNQHLSRYRKISRPRFGAHGQPATCHPWTCMTCLQKLTGYAYHGPNFPL
ncbi:hypothetical protein K458DRAFT_461025 [Lentithecium fluviatile CBS 122367]|uniref:Zn(2)-C6 fungal-type domain-containing protein n=1 Tax=Lentithecium fluviatile CBS 122367 TaxID=1168545 RepID=A0A6G1IMW2_9PLEO|nr:hypothetical protein K458DRAFT_461025 [Lentithecium fluviatile CBS 122367]